MRLNISRSGERALIACTQGREVGVDVEKERQDIEIDDQQNASLPPRRMPSCKRFPCLIDISLFGVGLARKPL